MPLPPDITPVPISVCATVSILAACRDERSYIAAFLESLAWQECPGVALEAVIADGLSSDGTREFLDQHAPLHTSPRLAIHVVENAGRTAACGLNLALHASQGSIVLRMDVHTEYAPDYVAQCLRALAETGASNVGGPALTRGQGYWQEAIAIAFRSPFFSGGARFHDPGYQGPVDTVPYGCWRRETLEALGGFDETLARNQDDELNFRITQAGGVVWQSPGIRSWYRPRHSLFALAGQYFEYGYWKPAVIAKHGRAAQWRHRIPATAAAAVIALSAAMPFSPAAGVLLLALALLYGAASALASLGSARNGGSLRLLPALPLVFLTVHVTYAAGFLAGLWKHRHRPKIALSNAGKALRAEPQEQ